VRFHEQTPSATPATEGPAARRPRAVPPPPAVLPAAAAAFGATAVLRLQHLAGNAAATAAVQRQRAHDASTAPPPGVQPGRFANSGTSRLGRVLGLHNTGPYFVNGIEIVFPLDPGARARYRLLRPRQWSGPEAVFFKSGPPLGSAWHTQSRGDGSGPDDPYPESQRVDADAVVYDDSPGPSLIGHARHTWIHAVQNFTGWVEGVPASGGAAERLTPVVAWHSVVSLVRPDTNSATSFTSTGFTRSGTGWVPTEAPDV
jgi:hypothetical protein